jgi:hypothetical protein
VAGKAAVIEDRSEDDEVPDIPAARLEPESEYDGASSHDDEGPLRGSASADGRSSIDSLWDQIEGTYTVQGRACSIVPIEEEVEGLRVETKQPPPRNEPSEVHNPAVRRRPEPGPSDRAGQPIRVPEEQKPLTGYYRVGRVVAHVMFDSGSGTNMITPDFARATGLHPIQLEKPIGLQMALIGSQGRINYGITVPVEVGPVTRPMYFDIANIERYDVIMGTPFMKQHRVALDFTNNEVIIGSQRLPDLFRADAPTASKRHPAAVKHKAIRAPTKTTSTTVEPAESRRAEPAK